MTWVVVWLAAAVYAVIRHWRSEHGVGLVLTYVVMFGTIHWLAPTLMLLPWNQGPELEFTTEGLRHSAFAMVAFAVGVEAVTLWRRHLRAADHRVRTRVILPRPLTTAYLISAVLLYGVISPLVGKLPTVAALASAGSTLMAVAVGLQCWNAWNAGHPGRMWLWVIATCVFPIFTVLMQGFLGYGYAATLVVLGFVGSFYRPRWQVLALGLVLAYSAMSVFVTYMRDRTDIRDVVWGGASIDERLSQLRSTFDHAEWFNPYEVDHLHRINGRLNQSYLVGASVSYLEGRKGEYAGGETLLDAVLAVVPRALWPDKPVVGGSGDIVTRYTGIRFAEGTSVGVGHVLELYVNFATTGVLVGFLMIGIVLTYLDGVAADRLARGDAFGFLLRYMPGLGVLQVGGSLAEVAGTAAASYVVVLALNRFLSSLRHTTSHEGAGEAATEYGRDSQIAV